MSDHRPVLRSNGFGARTSSTIPFFTHIPAPELSSAIIAPILTIELDDNDILTRSARINFHHELVKRSDGNDFQRPLCNPLHDHRSYDGELANEITSGEANGNATGNATGIATGIAIGSANHPANQLAEYNDEHHVEYNNEYQSE